SAGCGQLVVDAVVQRIRGAAGDSEQSHWFDVLGEVASNGGPEAVVALLLFLRDDDRDLRYQAAVQCKEVGDRQLALALCAALKDPDGQVRDAAVCALEGPIAWWAGEVVPALAGALGDGRAWTRGEAAHCLGKLGARATAALPTPQARLRASAVAVAG